MGITPHCLLGHPLSDVQFRTLKSKDINALFLSFLLTQKQGVVGSRHVQFSPLARLSHPTNQITWFQTKHITQTMDKYIKVFFPLFFLSYFHTYKYFSYLHTYKYNFSFSLFCELKYMGSLGPLYLQKTKWQMHCFSLSTGIILITITLWQCLLF